VCEALGEEEDAENVPFGEASGEAVVRQGLGGHSSIRAGDRKFYQSGSLSLRLRFGKFAAKDPWTGLTDETVAFRITKGVIIISVTFI